MAVMGAGKEFDMSNDQNILKINSPAERLNGGYPFVVVQKDLDERWAIVAFNWDGQPRLGVRWFWDKSGHPTTRQYATWLVLPDMVSRAYLRGIDGQMSQERIKLIEDFMNGVISGAELKKWFK